MTEEPLNLDTEEAVDRLTGALIGDIDSSNEQTNGENTAADLTDAEVDDLQTCLVLTLSDAARANLHGAIDTIKNVAVEECGIPEENPTHGRPTRGQRVD